MSTNAVQNPRELVTIVNEKNEVTGDPVTRAEMRASNLIHRCSYVIINNREGQVFVQKRVAFKETYPSFYDPAPGGVVGLESYEENAKREIEEEMGISGVELKHIFDFFYEDGISRVWGRLFSTTYEGPFELQESEVESARFMAVEEVRALIRERKVCPDSAVAFEKYYYGTTTKE
ncbi:NUDIX hydrolase [Chloropicon primus]|uniref:NUDIX hydrolase n=1 Tax=Chloropicon primus TaxID=1764295 RepID=A0A5B8MJZ8_9CHLO|nr:NUDIX hydrolase [Chloropicon primus]UPQ98894.1 NUDIX hydrolase [Chloropicon primus]|mmetsp:Transcript_4374/g.12872  ORF Transcript_4374/g.12872 Transcript_4374/m.12872 type:complete len:176 (-) Transcript_4374:132-659(-)|eukprot:QDZ19682.1 NUDIX hydrolase [Chloropicon primus]